MLLVGINAKYIHSNLAIRYLAAVEPRCRFCEYSIADRPEQIAAALYKTGEQIFLFSCYIWNIETIWRVCEILKAANSEFQIALGGPEVSFDAEACLRQHAAIDFILCGEGEPSITPFVDALMGGGRLCDVPGLVYRAKEGVALSPIPAQEAVLELLPFPYSDADMTTLKNRIVYFETSRGCPYRCAFCLSGSAGRLRFLSIERTVCAIDFFARHQVPLVKLVDRTFNADSRRALAIIEAIKARGGGTTYHFEIRAETMTEALIHSLQTAPRGMFQLEIGVQSTNEATLAAIHRKPDYDRLTAVVRALAKNQNMHLHLDLIAGLPGESLAMFIHSFHDVLALRPHDLQLGFLKKLKGAALYAPGSSFSSFAPYEVIHSDAMTYRELLLLKDVEEMLERYYNSGAFSRTMSYILETHYKDRAFYFFYDMAEFMQGDLTAKSLKTMFERLYQFGQIQLADSHIADYLTYDYCLRHRDSLSFMPNGEPLKAKAFTFLKDEASVLRFFPAYAGEKPTVLYKKLRFVPIGERIYAFDVQNEIAADVTEAFSAIDRVSLES